MSVFRSDHWTPVVLKPEYTPESVGGYFKFRMLVPILQLPASGWIPNSHV